MLIFGVDVGVTGAMALLRNGKLVAVVDLPAHEIGAGVVRRQVDAAGLAAIVREWRVQHGLDAELAVLERVSSMPGQGVSSVFSLGHSLGAVQGTLAALGVPTTLVAPQTWKRAMGLGRDKKQSQAAASRMFPAMAGEWARVRDHNRAEAALLAAYGWKEHA
jgi:hypothetical protein